MDEVGPYDIFPEVGDRKTRRPHWIDQSAFSPRWAFPKDMTGAVAQVASARRAQASPQEAEIPSG